MFIFALYITNSVPNVMKARDICNELSLQMSRAFISIVMSTSSYIYKKAKGGQAKMLGLLLLDVHLS